MDAANNGLNLDGLTEEDVMARFSQGLLDRATGSANLNDGPLSTPEWTIDVDHDEGEAMIESLEDEYE